MTACVNALSGEHVYIPSPFKTGRPACKNCGHMQPFEQYKINDNGRIVPTQPAPKPKRRSGKLTMQQAIKRHLEHCRYRDDPFVPAWDLRSKSLDFGEGEVFWVGTSGDRRARELAEAGEIIVERRQGYAYYAAKGANQPVLNA